MDDNMLEEKRVKCISCGTLVKVIIRPTQDMSGYICPQCETEDIGGDADW